MLSFISTKCKYCGGNIELFQGETKAKCNYCGAEYIIQNNTVNISLGGTYNNQYANKASHSVTPEQSKKLKESISIACNFKGAISGNSNGFIYLKSDGTLGTYKRDGGIDPKVFTWKNIKSFIELPRNRDDRIVLPIIALTFDGFCYESDCIELFNGFAGYKEYGNSNNHLFFPEIVSWEKVKEIYYTYLNGKLHIIGLKHNGKVLSSPEIPELNSWNNIKRIYVCGWTIVGIDAYGRVYAFGAKQYENEILSKWSDVKKITFPDSIITGIKSNGQVVYASLDTPTLNQFDCVLDIQDSFAILPDGAIKPIKKVNYPKYEILGSGYCQCKYNYFLSSNGRVDILSNNGLEVTREYVNNCVSMFIPSYGAGMISPIFILDNGKIDAFDVQIFAGNPADYRRKISHPIQDKNTKQTLLDFYNNQIADTKREIKQLGFGNRQRKNRLKAELDRLYESRKLQ